MRWNMTKGLQYPANILTSENTTKKYIREREKAVNAVLNLLGVPTAISFHSTLFDTEQRLIDGTLEPDGVTASGVSVKGCYEFEILYKSTKGRVVLKNIIMCPDAFCTFI